ncbi:sensor histidine kinase [Streptomyces sp. AJS327]|uniref:sensor histidine kinase n=1 Tax=Streptomyces sp. AJS327 TaxID=2545265 RepID=UPI0035B54F53
MRLTLDSVTAVLARTVGRQRGPAPRVGRHDVLVALLVLLLQIALALWLSPDDGRIPDAGGWLLLSASALVLVGARRAPWLVVLGNILCVGPYHAQEFAHTAVVPASLAALYLLALAGPPLRSFLTLGCIVGVMAMMIGGMGGADEVSEMMRTSGWLVATVLVGEAVRIHRDYVAAIVERAERAERTREEEAARRVVRERLRIARDLHDLLAHSITLIGVQTSVAAHVLVADPERLDREQVAQALDGIAETCRDARLELRTTLEVLRADDPKALGPLPGLGGLPDLARGAEGAGARVELTTATRLATLPLPPVVGAAAYRVVQEALTNAVRHAGPSVSVWVAATLPGDGSALRISVVDDGGEPGPDTGESAPGGYGIVGMRERARSIGGSLEAGPRTDARGFAVTATLPLGTVPDPRTTKESAR